ncbi:hypothetical protein WG68_04535 [Arsukibacterium ikkense]|uniref:Uncharacterized protein n=1 Tax=Arsukibacterium ikkense TaxID=336831 RepID=A0A0M2V825_9GAMM|nr:hypothetical protein [Arsukibacterium ikkense]KKO46574.1 hypothetical protein WG68_04535 [Arsukibacterium ikkense]
MHDTVALFKKLVMPLKQLGFHSERPLLPIVRELTQYLPLSEEAKLLLSAALAADLQVEEDFDSTEQSITKNFAFYGVHYDSATADIVFTRAENAELLRVSRSQAVGLPVPIKTEFQQIYFGYLLRRQLLRQHDVLVVTACQIERNGGNQYEI